MNKDEYIAWSLCLCVCVLVTTASPAKTDESIDTATGLLAKVGQRNRVLDGGPDELRPKRPQTKTATAKTATSQTKTATLKIQNGLKPKWPQPKRPHDVVIR